MIESVVCQLTISNDLWIGAVLGTIVSSIIGIFIFFIKNWQRKCRFKNQYSKYEGSYLAYQKYDTGQNTPFRSFKLQRKGNEFFIENGKSCLGYPDFIARIRMDENSRDHGRGYYYHDVTKDNIVRFGFLEVQLANDLILVHETIYNEKGEQNSDAYRWIKQIN
jgi:hypothetical protein